MSIRDHLYKQTGRRVLSTALLCLLLSGELIADQINVAVASNFVTTLRKLAVSFEQTSDHKLRISSASTGKLYAQISHGAPFDLFLAADEARPARLVSEGKAVADSRFTYALGQLVFWSPSGAATSDGEALLRSGNMKRLAIANPKTAPYGIAAQMVLTEMNLWPNSSLQLVRGENVGQTFQFITTGAVDGGFIALAQITGSKQWDGLIWQIPDSYYSPIRQQVVLLNGAADKAAAQAFLAFLRSDPAKTIIRQNGYAIEESND